MRRSVPQALLILLLMLTGIGLGHARGQVLVDGTVVLCSGEAVTRVPGGPGGHDRPGTICPDMALSLLTATPPPVPFAGPPPAAVLHLPRTRPAAVAAPRASPHPVRARGPPLPSI